MTYKITVKLNTNDRFRSSINFLRASKSFYFDVIFTAVSIVALVYTLYTKIFFTMSLFHRLLLIICVLLFPVLQPLILYIKSRNNNINNAEINLEFTENEIKIYSSTESATVLYQNVYNFIKFKNMLVIMYDRIHGQIIPDRFLNFDKDEFYTYVETKIKNARKNYEKDY